jgi:hypothetical protein
MFAIGRLGDVGRDCENSQPAFLLDRRCGARQRLLRAPGDRDPRARSGESAGDRIADASAAAGYDRDLAVELADVAPAPLLGAGRGGRSGNGQAIDWKRRARALMCFAVSMSRSVIFMPASCVQNENVRMLYELWNSG